MLVVTAVIIQHVEHTRPACSFTPCDSIGSLSGIKSAILTCSDRIGNLSKVQYE